MSYAIKFRERALAYHSGGHSWRMTMKTFGISSSTLSNWLKKSLSGSLSDIPVKRQKRKISDEKLRKYVSDNPDAYQSEMAECFGCSQQSICTALKRAGITRKKDQAVQRGRY